MNSNKNSPITFFFLVIAMVIIAACFFKHTRTPKGSDMLGSPLAEFDIPSLYHPEKRITNRSLGGQVYLLHFWASWCSVCRSEHAMLLKIQRKFHIPILGVSYKDQQQNAEYWLTNSGNPFAFAGDDPKGILGAEMQLYGTPQTYIIDKFGRVRYQYLGLMTESDWMKIVFPLIEQYQVEQFVLPEKSQ
jgi:cytochrome c biogenesis protein CcmG/thiol:disulfide interchange protein DsbE